MGDLSIGWLDPSIDSRNAGDLVIAESIAQVLVEILPEQARVLRFPTQRPLTREERQLAKRCNSFVVGGTNLLSSNMHWYRQWKLRPADVALFKGNVHLLGVGWWQYQRPPNSVTKTILRRVLAPSGQSVRDSYTLRRLAAVGIESLNTTCPTMWNLDAQPEQSETPGDTAVVTITDYNRDVEADRRLLELLREVYDHIAIWPQGAKDAPYVARLAPWVEVLKPGLDAFEQALADGADYVGTRLHAGIRALQRGRRATIVTVDNRASEIAKDTGLPVISRRIAGGDQELLLGQRRICLRIPHHEIGDWKSQMSAILDNRV